MIKVVTQLEHLFVVSLVIKNEPVGLAGQRAFYWRETTDAQPFETGIQRVTRRLADGLIRCGVDLVPVGWDPWKRLPRLPDSAGSSLDADWLLVPEIPMTVLSEDLDPIQLARAYGLRSAAIVHDLIPVRLAHLYDAGARALFRRYFRMFAGADLVLATTNLVASQLRAHLHAEGLTLPPITVVPLPAQFADVPRVQEARAICRPGDPLRLITVSTWEPRKNLPRLLRSVLLAQDRSGHPIHLTLVGRRGGYLKHDAEVDALLAANPNATARDQVGDHELADLYARCHASVYTSCDEGFGMPVLESLWLGRPCLCHTGSAMAEVAPGGGTLMLDMSDEVAIADALVRMSAGPGLLDKLTDEVLARPLRTWDEYATDVADHLWMTAKRV